MKTYFVISREAYEELKDMPDDLDGAIFTYEDDDIYTDDAYGMERAAVDYAYKEHYPDDSIMFNGEVLVSTSRDMTVTKTFYVKGDLVPEYWVDRMMELLRE